MKIAVGSDHAGFPLKEAVLNAIQNAGHEAIDLGVDQPSRVDFPDYGEKVGRAIQNGEADRGIAICGSGVGMCITVNKMRGVYGAICHDTYSAHQGVEHDNMNVLCLGGRVIGPEPAAEIVTAFVNANYLNSGRFAQRVEKILKLEETESSKKDFPQ
ncbi:MAG: ribose 5-phosphate isomerase B [Anaerolineaceae bacterium]|nr:ribose 5-phosphate isomerase B [Anaerolineaceae bacterium]